MRAEPPADDGLGPQGGGRLRLLFWGALVLLLAGASWLLFWPHGPQQQEAPAPLVSRQAPAAGQHAAVLYFADRDAQTLVTERRDVPFGDALEENVEIVVRALIAGPHQSGHVAVLPSEARLLQTFYAEASRTLYLDFSSALVTRHPGGSAAEYLTLSAVVRTIAANFTAVARVQLLVDGQAIETLAGHFDTSKPIDIADWQ
jgi:spore germination protein GerM